MASSSATPSQSLCDAAIKNDVNALSELVATDGLLLLRPLPSSNSCSALHIASQHGCLPFVKELLSQNPTLCGVPDSNKSSPLHIASQYNHSDIIELLVEANPAMCFSRDMQGMTPFHLAAINGCHNALEKLLSLKPVAAKERVGGVGGDTILHLCVKYDQLDALKTVTEKVGEAELLNAKNGDGNTILHLAVANKQPEILEELLKEKRLKKNTINSNGWTAADILKRSNEHVREDVLRKKLREAGAFPSTDVKRDTETDMYLSWFESKRGALIVAASLIATVAFQAGINPPGGVWQDTQPTNSTTTAASRTTTHIPGSSIMSYQVEYNYRYFLALNNLCLLSSISSMVLLIFPLRPGKQLLHTVTFSLYFTLGYLILAYSVAVYSMTYGQPITMSDGMRLFMLPLLGTIAVLTLSWTYIYVLKWTWKVCLYLISKGALIALSLWGSTGRRR